MLKELEEAIRIWKIILSEDPSISGGEAKALRLVVEAAEENESLKESVRRLNELEERIAKKELQYMKPPPDTALAPKRLETVVAKRGFKYPLERPGSDTEEGNEKRTGRTIKR